MSSAAWAFACSDLIASSLASPASCAPIRSGESEFEYCRGRCRCLGNGAGHCLLQPVVSEEVLGLSLEERQALQAQAIAEDDGEWEKELDAQNKARAGINEEDYT